MADDAPGPINRGTRYGAYDHRERRTDEQKASDKKAAQEKDAARAGALGGERVRSEAAARRRAESEAIKQAARREKERLDSEAATDRADRNGKPSQMVGKGGTTTVGDEIVKSADTTKRPRTVPLDMWENGVLVEKLVCIE